jgi:hypothetical protein
MNSSITKAIAQAIYPDIFRQVENMTRLNKKFADDSMKLEEEISELKGSNQMLTKENQSLSELYHEATDVKESPLDAFCRAKYPQITNIRYKQKRSIKGKYYSVELNDLQNPNQFEVRKYKGKCSLGENLYDSCKVIGDKVAKDFTWTDDKNLDSSGDYYLSCEEFIALLKGDCEDHANLVASLISEVGVAYGFFHPNAKTKYGHAFNVFVYMNQLYVLDTVGDFVYLEKFAFASEKYSINYIITKTKTYCVDGSVKFGELAGF